MRQDLLAQERWEEPDMEFHHIGTDSSTNGATPEHSTVAADDLEIDAAQGGANKVSCHVLPHAHLSRRLPVLHRMPHRRVSMAHHLDVARSVQPILLPALFLLAGREHCRVEVYAASYSNAGRMKMVQLVNVVSGCSLFFARSSGTVRDVLLRVLRELVWGWYSLIPGI